MAKFQIPGPQGEAPSIYKLPESLPRVDEGSKIRLDAVVSGTPTPEVVWFRNGREIVESGRIQMRSSPDGSHQLIIPDGVPSDTADYSISATN